MDDKHVLAVFNDDIRARVDQGITSRLVQRERAIGCGVMSDAGFHQIPLELGRLRVILKSQPALLTVFVSDLRSDEVSAIKASHNGGRPVACGLVVLTQDPDVWNMLPVIRSWYRFVVNVGPMHNRWNKLFPELAGSRRAYDVPNLINGGVALLIETIAEEERKARLQTLGPIPPPYASAE